MLLPPDPSQLAYFNAYPIFWEPEAFRSMIYSHPESEHVRWWKRTVASTYNHSLGAQSTSDSVTGGAGYQVIDMSAPVAARKVIVAEPQLTRKFGEFGKYESGDLVMVGMPDEFPGIGYSDWILPIGNNGWTPGQAPDTRVYRESQSVVRGEVLIPQAGTVVSAGSVVTGTGTAFTSAFAVGDVIVPASNPQPSAGLRITAISSDTSLTVESSPAPAWSGIPYLKGVDTLLYHPVAALDDIRAESTVYASSSYQVSADGSAVQWTDPVLSPAPGTRYSVLFRYQPKYVVVPNMGSLGHVVNGSALPFRLVLRLWQPETHRTAGAV